MKYYSLLAVLILVVARTNGQSTRCFTEYMQAYTEWGMETVPDGEQTVIIAIEDSVGKQTCLMGKIGVKDMNVVPPLYVLRENGSYENAAGRLDIDFYKREAEGPIPTRIEKAMTATYFARGQHKVRLFFQDYLKEYPGKRVVAPSLGGQQKETAEKISASAKSIGFESGKDVITAASYSSLNEIATAMKANPDIKWTIEGYTDNTGKKETNLKLSQKRADAVLNYLIAQGVNGANLNAKGYGDQSPIADNATKEGRAQNRRVEIKPVQ